MILILDSSASEAVWAGVEDGALINPMSSQGIRQHDTSIPMGVSNWFNEIKPTKLDAIAVVVGPGGYAGLRVGVAFATALAMARSVPLIPVSTYQAIAARADESTKVWVLLPLRRNVCRGRLMFGGPLPQPLNDPEEIHLDGSGLPIHLDAVPLGEGFIRYESAFRSLYGNQPIREIPLLSRHEGLARVAWMLWKRGATVEPSKIDVDYGGEFKPTLKTAKS